jgi:hypothetical protein
VILCADQINKVRNTVLLKHLPTGLQVRCQEFRELALNRARARKIMIGKLDLHLNGGQSCLPSCPLGAARAQPLTGVWAEQSRISQRNELLRKRKNRNYR